MSGGTGVWVYCVWEALKSGGHFYLGGHLYLGAFVSGGHWYLGGYLCLGSLVSGDTCVWEHLCLGGHLTLGCIRIWGTLVSVDTCALGGTHSRQGMAAQQTSIPSPQGGLRFLLLRVQRQRPHLGQSTRSLLTAAPGGGPRAEDGFCGERLCVETSPSPPSTSPSVAPLEKAPPLFPRRKDVREVHEVLRFKVTSQPCQEVSGSMSIFSFNLKFRRWS